MEHTLLQSNSAVVFLEALGDFMGFGVLAVKDFKGMGKDVFIDDSLSTGMTLETIALPLVQMYDLNEIIEFGGLVDENITLRPLEQQGGQGLELPPVVPFLINHSDITAIRQRFVEIFQELAIYNETDLLGYIDSSLDIKTNQLAKLNEKYSELDNPFMVIKPNYLTPTKTIIDYPCALVLNIEIDTHPYLNPRTRRQDQKVTIYFKAQSIEGENFMLSTSIEMGLRDVFEAIGTKTKMSGWVL